MLSLSQSIIRPSPLQLQLYANTIIARVRSHKEPLERAVDEVIRPRIRQNFMSESEAGERSWTPLADTTRVRREKAGYSGAHPILVRQGRLRRAAQQKNMWIFRGQGVAPFAQFSMPRLQSRVPYAEKHQEGEGRLIARPYLVINDWDAKRIEEVFADYLVKRELIAAKGIGWLAVRRDLRG